jgi:hypothetical protein
MKTTKILAIFILVLSISITAGSNPNALDAADGSPTDVVYVDNEGNVGIWKTRPSSKLDVNGDINANGNINASCYKIADSKVLSIQRYNLFVGDMAGLSNTASGFYNTFLGYSAGNSNTEGSRNTFLGTLAGRNNITGSENTFLGGEAGRLNTKGNQNTFLGSFAGRNNIEGNYNTLLGAYAGHSITTGSGNVFIGSHAGYNESGSNKLYIANSKTGAPLIYGEFNNGKVGIGTTNPLQKLDVRGSVYFSGNVGVGIGMMNPTEKLQVAGTIHSTSGGFKFPDGSVQTSAATGGGSGGFSLPYNGSISRSGNAFSITNTGSGKAIYAKGGSGGYAAEFQGKVKISSRSSGNTVMELGEGLDYAEGFDVSNETGIEPGTVLIIDADNPGKLTINSKAYDKKVAGIVAGAKGLGSGVQLGAGQFDYPVALAGRVYCNVDATEAAVEPGDLLTTSSRPGYAAKAVDYKRAQGAILGKAMERIEKGKKGQILVLVTLQ